MASDANLGDTQPQSSLDEGNLQDDTSVSQSQCDDLGIGQLQITPKDDLEDMDTMDTT